MAFSRSSDNRLTGHDLDRFPGRTLFDRIGRVVCRAGCLPRRELYESWEVARRVRREFRGGRVVDLAGGHGLLGQIMLVLDSSATDAVVVDARLPPSSQTLQAVLAEAWPVLAGRVTFISGTFDAVELEASDVVVASHACGPLTDDVLERAAAARARVAVLPCCHDLRRTPPGELKGWVDGPLAIDIERAVRLRQHGYRIWTQTIPGDITPKNRLLFGQPL